MSLTLEKITADITPVVEIDTEAPAAYVRCHNPVARTVMLRDDEILSTLDLDSNGNVIGIKVVWPTEFGIEKLIAESRADVVLPPVAIKRTRYVPVKRSA